MSLDEMVKPLVSDFKSDKRNKVFVPENILITSRVNNINPINTKIFIISHI